eukprot:1195604-Prorocentrum_minimum.AAC.4
MFLCDAVNPRQDLIFFIIIACACVTGRLTVSEEELVGVDEEDGKHEVEEYEAREAGQAAARRVAHLALHLLL